MKVADAMSRQVEFLTSDATVKDVSRLIFGRGINGLPILKNEKVVGFVTERDILAKFYPTVTEYMEDIVNTSDFEKMEGKTSEILSLKIDKIMSKKPIVISENDPLLKAQSIMFIKKVGRLPVVNKQKKLVGIISKSDIFRALVGERLNLAENEEYNDWLSKHYFITVDWGQRLKYEIPDLVKVFNKQKARKILDIGCGIGEHTIALAKEGFMLYGFERSELMIKEAKKKHALLPKRIKNRIKFFSGEYEDSISKINDSFDAAIFMGNSISHNPDKYKSILKLTSEVLSKSSVMMFQITNFEKIFKKKKRLSQFKFVKSGGFEENAFLEFYDRPPKEGNTILKTFSIFDFNGKRWSFYGLRNSIFANLNKGKMKKLLTKNGFKKIGFYGSYYENDKWDYLFKRRFEPLKSDWLNIVAIR